MSVIEPRMVLKCALCSERPPADSVLEAWLLHMQVEHDTDDVSFELIAVCTCGTQMSFGSTLTHHNDRRGLFEDRYFCLACTNNGSVWRQQ